MKRFIGMFGAMIALLMASTVNAAITYIGNYSYQGAPAIIVQFDDKVPKQNAASLLNPESEQAYADKWLLNSTQTALIYPNVEVGKKYRVKLNHQLQYQDQAQLDVEVFKKEPSVQILGRGPVIASHGKRALPVSVTNAEQLSMEILQVTDPAALLNKLPYASTPSMGRLNRLAPYFKAVTHLNFELEPQALNQAQYNELKLPDSLEDGWYILVLKATGTFGYDVEQVVQVALTDIGIQTKVFAEHLAVQLTSLANEQAIEGAELSIYHHSGQQTKLGTLTTSQAQFDYQVQQGDTLVAHYQGKMSFLPLREIPLDLSDFKVTGRKQQTLNLFAYSNRDLFKPGEQLPLNLILRDKDGEQVKEASRLYVEYIQPDRRVASGRWLDAEGQSGFFQNNYQIPANAAVGKWTAVFKLHKESKQSLSQFEFNVSEFVPERMDLTVEMAKSIPFGATNVSANLHGKYLFGSPAANNRVSASATYRASQHFSGPLSDYFVGQHFSIEAWRDVPEIKDIQLDKNGKYQWQLPLYSAKLMKSPVNARFTFELFETGGATISRSQQRQLWTGDAIAGIKAPEGDVDSYSTHYFDVALLSGDGQTLQKGQLNYQLERNAGGYYWVYSESEGWDIRSDDEWRPIRSDIISLEEAKPYSLPVDIEWGRYRITLTTQDGVITRYPFWAGWNESEQQQPVKPDQLAIALDKPRYQDGDKVIVTVNSEQAGELQLNLETDQVLLHQSQQISAGEQRFEFDLPKDLKRHDTYLSATLVANQATSHPRRFFAVAPVKLDRSSRQLQVSVEHPEKLLPDTKANITVRLAKPVNKPTWVTLSLMDRGIVNLARYQVPKINPWFFAQRRYGADVIDLYSRFYQLRPDSFAKPHRYGGDQEINLNINRDKLVESKTITFMSQLVEFDANGQATFEVDIPDYNGQAQIVAMAFSDNEFGQAESNVSISTPVVAELAIARFLAPESRSQTYLELFNTTEETQQVVTTVSADKILTIGQAEHRFELAPGERKGVALPFEVGNIEAERDTATLSLKVNVASGFEQTRTWQIPVRHPEPLITQRHLVTLSGLSQGSNSYQLDAKLWQDYQPFARPIASVSYARSPRLNIQDYAQNLFRYPYGCAEQTTSKALPWLLQSEELTPLKQQAQQGRSVEAILEQAIHRLSTMQKANGSFSLWSKHGKEDPWLSAYVSDFLFQTHNQYPGLVPKQMLESAKKNIAGYGLKQNMTASRFYALWLGSQQGWSSPEVLFDVAKKLDNPPSRLALAQLAGALLLNGGQQQAMVLFNQIDRFQPPASQYYAWDYGSKLRDLAATISILSEIETKVKLNHQLQSLRNKLALQVVALANQRNYLSTQEKIALVQAGIQLKQLNQSPLAIELTEQSQTKHINREGQGLYTANTRLTNTSDEPVYLQVSTTGMSKPGYLKSTLPHSVAARIFRFTNGKLYDGRPLKVGEKLIVSLRFQLKQKAPSALIVEYLPAGFVLENPDFTNSRELIRAADIKPSSAFDMLEYRNDRLIASTNMQNKSLYVLNYVVRAETPGVGKVPAMFLEQMYQPENMLYQADRRFREIEIQP